MNYIRFHTELREDYLKEHLSNIKRIKTKVKDDAILLLSLNEIIQFFDDALLYHEENKNISL